MVLQAQVIFLNGPSSAGKTTIAKALQERLDKPYLLIGIDKMIGLMPKKLNSWEGDYKEDGFCWVPAKNGQGVELRVGPYAEKISQSLKDVACLLVSSGYNVIIDEVVFGGEEVERWRKALAGIPALFVGVKAPIDVLQQREKERGDRLVGSTQHLAPRVHQGAHYDLVVDTHEQSLEENVEKIISVLAR